MRLWSTITRITRLFGNRLAAGAFFIHIHHNTITNTFSLALTVILTLLFVLIFTLILIV